MDNRFLREAPSTGYVAKYYALTIVLTVAVCLLPALFFAVTSGAFSFTSIAVIAIFCVVFGAATLATWFPFKKEGEKIADDVRRHSVTQEEPVRLDVWLPKATILQSWPEGEVIVANGFITVSSNGAAVLNAPVKDTIVKFNPRGIKIKSSGGNVRLAPVRVEGSFMVRVAELYKFRCEELRVALEGRQPVWTVFQSAALQVPTYPLREQQQLHANTQQYQQHQQYQQSQNVYTQQSGNTPQAGLPPQGWHPDPHGVARLRWWDGTRWTEHTAD